MRHRKVFKIFLIGLTILFSAIIVIVAALHNPRIQTKIVKKLASVISNKIELPVEIGYVNLSWYDELYVNGISIKDTEGEKLIDINEMTINFNLTSLFGKEDIHLDKAWLSGASVALKNNSPDSLMNMSFFAKKIREALSTGEKGKGKVFSIGEVFLDNSRFTLNNLYKDSVVNRWDVAHFGFSEINGRFNDMRIHKDTFEINIDHLSCIDNQSRMRVSKLKTQFSISQSTMAMRDMELEVGSSILKNDMVFHYDRMEGLSNFNHQVTIRADLSQSKIYSKDLGWFAPNFATYDHFFTIAGKFNGMISRFSFNDFVIAFGEKTLLQGDMNITGLPAYKETLFDIDLDQTFISSKDFESMLSRNVYAKVSPIDYITANSVTLTGFLFDFVARGKFTSPLGLIDSDINLKLNDVPSQTAYSGNLALTDFDVGKLVGNKMLNQVDMWGEIAGKGIQPENADFKLRAFFNYFDFNEYRYKNINADARFTKELFIGTVNINDDNLRFDAQGMIDIRGEQNKIELTARLDTASLRELKLSDDEYLLSADIDVDFTGLKLDEFLGTATISNAFVSVNSREAEIDYLNIISEKSDQERILYVQSDHFSLNLTGNYKFSRLINDVQDQYEEYRLSILNQADLIEEYYKKKIISLDQINDYYLKYEVNLKNINPLIQLFSPTAYISENAKIEGVLTGGYTNLVSAYSTIDTINIGKYNFYNNLFDFRLSKNIDRADVNATAHIASSKQSVDRIERSENLFTTIDWNGKQADFSIGLQQSNSQNSATLSGKLDFLYDITQIVIDSSDIQILEKNWLLSEDNNIVIDNKTVSLNNFVFYHEEQSISLNGLISPDSTQKKLEMHIRDFTLDNLNPLFKKNRLNGRVNGNLQLTNISKNLIWESQVDVQDFSIGNFPVGHITLNSLWNNQVKHLNIGLDVIRNNQKIIAMNGYVDPQDEENQLHLFALLNQAHLNIAEPFVADLFSQINGHASGEFIIRGSLRQPELYGTGSIENGKLKVNYLNTDYTFSGEVRLDENVIGVDNLILRDDELNRAQLSGGFYHTGLKNFIMDINCQLTDFKVLNTNSRINDLYYGVAIVSGNVNFLGAPTNLNISANATTQRGTKIFIPLGGGSTVEQENFIRFITRSDSLVSEDAVNKIDIRGLKLDFDLDITPEAYCELIFDIKAGDIIRGRGNGKIKLQIDTESDFRMFGDFEIMEGGYNFTLYNVINKEFTINPKSLITWTGDPYKAQMNINATYDQMASIAPLLDTALWSYPDVKRKYPAKVLLDLQGDLMSPDIGFDIDISDYPMMISSPESGATYPLDTYINGFRNKIRSDEQEMKRQVFSLMVLRRFSPENSFDVSGSLGNSVSEFISNQLSYWITQFDENLEIDVDLNSLDQEAFNTFQLRLSYTTMDGRLRITRDGGFTNQQNQTNLGAIAGDWTVEYLLTPNGKLRVKMYNKTNYNTFNYNSLNRQGLTSTTAGFSLMHTESFDKLNEVFRNIKAKKEKNKEEDEDAKNQDAIIKEDQELAPKESKLTDL